MADANYLKVEPFDPNKPIDPELADKIFQESRKESISPSLGGNKDADIYVRVGDQTFHLLTINLQAIGELLRRFS